MPIKYHDRVFVAGQSSSGKSELLNYFFSRLTCQKVLMDTKGEFAIDDDRGNQIPPTRRAEDVDWSQPVIHFQELAGDLDEYDELCYQVVHRRNIAVCCHELGDLCEDQANKTPRWVRRHIRTGNVFGDGWLSGSQRPVGMPRQARTEAQHVIQMVPVLDPEDHKIVAPMMGINDYELRRLVDQAAALSPTGEYSFVWFDKRTKRPGFPGITLWPPLPENLRSQIRVRRTANV